MTVCKVCRWRLKDAKVTGDVVTEAEMRRKEIAFRKVRHESAVTLPLDYAASKVNSAGWFARGSLMCMVTTVCTGALSSSKNFKRLQQQTVTPLRDLQPDVSCPLLLHGESSQVAAALPHP